MNREESIEVIKKMATELQIAPDSTQGQAIQQALKDMNFVENLSYVWKNTYIWEKEGDAE